MGKKLPIRKIYIDSRYKTDDSVSDSNFQLSQPLQLPDKCVCFIDDIIIPHTFYTIESYNCKLYFREKLAPGDTITDVILNISQQNHTGTSLASSIKSILDATFGSNNYNCTYNSTRGTITISRIDTNRTFIVFTDFNLKSDTLWLGGPWTGPSYNPLNPQSCNDVLRHYTTMVFNSTWESGHIDIRNIHNLYISSPSLGSYSTLGVRGEQNIIKKVPVSSDFGYLIIDNIVANHDYVECSKQTLSMLEFHVKNTAGDFVNLHGSSISMSLIFALNETDDD